MDFGTWGNLLIAAPALVVAGLTRFWWAVIPVAFVGYLLTLGSCEFVRRIT
jgi:hypothetical protein